MWVDVKEEANGTCLKRAGLVALSLVRLPICAHITVDFETLLTLFPGHGTRMCTMATTIMLNLNPLVLLGQLQLHNLQRPSELPFHPYST